MTQLRYARQGMVTPEMEFIAIREKQKHAAYAAQHPGQAWGAAIPRSVATSW